MGSKGGMPTSPAVMRSPVRPPGSKANLQVVSACALSLSISMSSQVETLLLYLYQQFNPHGTSPLVRLVPTARLRVCTCGACSLDACAQRLCSKERLEIAQQGCLRLFSQ